VGLFQKVLQGQELVPDSAEQGQHLVFRGSGGQGPGRQQAVVLGFVVHLAAHGGQAQLFFFPETLDFEDELDIGGAV
jgi:hypothetical protein